MLQSQVLNFTSSNIAAVQDSAFLNTNLRISANAIGRCKDDNAR